MRSLIITALFFVTIHVIGQVPTNGLVAYYPFDGNANEAIGSVSGINGVLNGVVPTVGVKGVPGSGLLFNGNNNSTWVDIADNPVFDFGTGDYSVSIWLKYLSPQPGNGYNYSMIFCKGGFEEVSPGLSVFADYLQTSPGSGGTSNGAITIRSTSDDYASANLNNNVNDNQWHHFVFSRVGNEFRIYADKVLKASRIVPIENLDNSFPLRFGANQDFTSAQNYTGSMDEVRFYNRALSSQEIASIYQSEMPSADISAGLVAFYPFNGNANDESGHNNNGVVTGAIFATDRLGNNNSCYSFDGNSRIVCPDFGLPIGNTARTISAWIKAEQLQSLMGSGIPPGHIVKYGVELNETQHCNVTLWGNNIRFSNWSSPPDAEYAFTHPIGEWFQVITRLDEENVVSLFINGAMVYSTSVEIWNTISSGALILGDFLTNGKLDDVRIYNRALTQQEIADLYNTEKAPVTISSGLISYYPFNGNSNDESGNLNHGVNHGATLVADRFGAINKAYSFNGLSDTIIITSQRNVLGNSSRSIAAWIRLPESPNPFNTIYKGGDNGDGNDFSFIIKNVYAGIIQLYIRRYNDDIWSEDISYTPNQWMHVAVSYDGTNGARMKFYVNGVLLGTVNGGSQTFNTIATNPVIGNHISQGGFYHFFKGEIDDLMIYNRALEQTEIQQLASNSGPECSLLEPKVISSVVNATTLEDGTLPVNIEVQTCPESIGIISFKYWFDGNEASARYIETQGNAYLNFIERLDCEALQEGSRVVSYQFKNSIDHWTPVVEKPFIKIKQTFKSNVEPKVFLSKTSLVDGEKQIVSGLDFSSGGRVNVYLFDPVGKMEQLDDKVAYVQSGKFTLSIDITSSFIDGEYKVVVRDVESNRKSSDVYFTVDIAIPQTLVVKKPVVGNVVYIGVPTEIVWEDYVEKKEANGNTGTVTKRYMIEQSFNGGTFWEIVSYEFVRKEAIPGIVNYFQFRYISSLQPFFLPLSVKFRVTDLDNSANTFTTGSFEIKEKARNGFYTDLLWDKSAPYFDVSDRPVGVAADGTSRILVRVSKESLNNGIVTQIKANIVSYDPQYSGEGLLGKIMLATNSNAYSEEGNLANSLSITVPISEQKDYYDFWLVSPDNFIDDINSELSERSIRVDFDISYSNKGDDHVTEEDIQIVRPPLMFVHGLNSSSSAFNGAKYKVGIRVKYFDNDYYGKSELWKVIKRVDLDGQASFSRNAEIILGKYDMVRNLPNTFRGVLHEMHKMGYASNRVDYVCHSMGGDIARTVINKYASDYSPSVESSVYYKNYGKGFINKLITINTPHNGSPIADVVTYGLPLLTYGKSPVNAVSNTFVGILNSTCCDGFFKWNDKLGIFEASDAIKDMRSTVGGIRFNTTIVKNHLIGGDILKGTLLSNQLDAFGVLNSRYIDLLIQSIPANRRPSSSSWFSTFSFLDEYFLEKYGIANFFSNSDGVVSSSSQFPGYDISLIPDLDLSPNAGYSASNSYGLSRFHVSVTNDLEIGTKVFTLLNSSISSTNFSNSIASNGTGLGSGTYQNERAIADVMDSVIFYSDTNSVKILQPLTLSEAKVDSSLKVVVSLKDTVGFRRIQVLFQGQYFESASGMALQNFDFKVAPGFIGKTQARVNAVYDSVGYVIYRVDTCTVNIVPSSPLISFNATPGLKIVNPGQRFRFDYTAVYDGVRGKLAYYNEDIQLNIADTSVVIFDTASFSFLAKDTGSTFIKVSYLGKVDTVFVYLNSLSEYLKEYCAGGSFEINALLQGDSYQWQVDKGNGFQDLANDSVHSNVNSAVLLLTSPPTKWRGYKYRCQVTNSNSITFSGATLLRFNSIWNGSVDSDWTNSLNWECGAVPDEYVDVIIEGGKTNYPVLMTDRKVNSLMLKDGATVNLSNGALLFIMSKF